MPDPDRQYPVAIVGGGPTGLLLGLLLARSGIPPLVLEKRSSIDPHSRSLGIHPPLLEHLDTLGLSHSMIQEGIEVKRGHAYVDHSLVGTLHFDRWCPPPHRYILTLPQNRTESILESALEQSSPGSLIRSCRVEDIVDQGSSAVLELNHSGKTLRIRCRWVIGCDGSRSHTRSIAQIPVDEKSYEDFYLMGDSPDTTRFENDAAVYLHQNGLVESFPLPGGNRRWVARRHGWNPPPSATELSSFISERTGWSVPDDSFTMISRFGVQQRIARTLCKGAIVLAGDAAHVVSPIGGQGMNLGWLTAFRLAKALRIAMDRPDQQNQILNEYSRESIKKARQTGRRAEWNMRMGRQSQWPVWARKWSVRPLINAPLNRLTARLFTMRGLGRWPI